MSFAVTPKAKGDEDKAAASLRRLSEEDPTLILRRDERTGEQLLAGLSQMHVEVAVDRLHRRFGVDVDLAQPRVPYLETIRTESRARARYKKQTGGRGQFGDCEIVLEPRPGHEGYEFVDKIVGGVIPQGFRPAVDKGIQEAMLHGELAGAPVQGVTVRLVDGQYHNVDSSEMAFKIAGSMAFKDAYQKADPMLLEPIMELEVTVPDEAVGAVNGDLNSRRGRLHGMEPLGGMTTIKAEVPMAEVLTYSQSLTSLTGGRGDYHMSFLRYEEVPGAHRAEAHRGREEGPRVREGVVPGGAAAAVSCAICGRTLLVGRGHDALLARRHRVPRRLPALPGARDGGRLVSRRRHEPSRPCSAAPQGLLCPPLRRPASIPACGRSADPQPPVPRPAVDRRSGRALQRQPAPPHGRGPHAQPRHASCSRRRPRRQATPASSSPGRSPGTDIASSPTPPTPCRWSNVASTPLSWAPTTTGTPTWTPPDVSCRELHPSNRSNGGVRRTAAVLDCDCRDLLRDSP